jgi:hypothetical protein
MRVIPHVRIRRGAGASNRLGLPDQLSLPPVARSVVATRPRRSAAAHLDA